MICNLVEPSPLFSNLNLTLDEKTNQHWNLSSTHKLKKSTWNIIIDFKTFTTFETLFETWKYVPTLKLCFLIGNEIYLETSCWNSNVILYGGISKLSQFEFGHLRNCERIRIKEHVPNESFWFLFHESSKSNRFTE